ncbi:glycosyl transferase family 1 [Nucisporomicrobium flavum]|uniref:glycosyl transferase family 1 n=1 Tax=Nucisporomicrobium flavum TaxID=2785915 RepID=UPI003C30A401
MSNLFAGWPKDRLGQVYTAYMPPSTEVCDNYFHFPPREHYKPSQYRAMRILGWDGRSPLQQSRSVAVMQTASRSRPGMAKLYSHMSALPDLSPVRSTRQMEEWVEDFRPDLIYSMLGSIRMTRIAALVARTCNVPIVPHFTDDWAATLYDSGQLFGRANRAMQAGIHDIISMSPLGMVISSPMAKEYEKRYGIPFFPFMNCADETYFSTAAAKIEPESEIRLAYVGALHLNRWKSLLDIGVCLGELDRSGVKTRLVIHSPQRDLDAYGCHFAGIPQVQLGPSLESWQVPHALHSASVLVHVESFDEEIRRYTHYSISTKIPQYLAAARPILGYGPSEVASINHIREAQAGLTVGVSDRSQLLRALAELCSDSRLRAQLGQNGAAFARREHAKESVAFRFAATLRSAMDPQKAVSNGGQGAAKGGAA